MTILKLINCIINIILYVSLIIGICLIPIFLFMLAWNYVVDYFNLNIPHIGMFISFMILILVSFLRGFK